MTSRKHKILRVYVHDAAGHELVLLGHVQMACRNGINLDLPFSARVVVDDDAMAQGRRLKYMQVFAVSSGCLDSASVVAHMMLMFDSG